MSVEAKIDKILDKLEQTRVDIEVLCNVVKDNKEDIRKTEDEIKELQEKIELINLEVNSLKFVVSILKWTLGVAVTFTGAIIGNMFI